MTENEIITGAGGIPSVAQKAQGRPTLSPKIRDFVLGVKRSRLDDNKWDYIDVPLARGQYSKLKAKYVKSVINYRRLRPDYENTRIKTITCREDAPKGYFRIWIKIVPK